MKPPYQITEKILKLVVRISEKLGEINATYLYKPPTELRKKNRIKTIQSSLEIEGNTLTEEQITALLDSKRIPSEFCSLGQDIEYYEKLKQLFANYLISNLFRQKISNLYACMNLL